MSTLQSPEFDLFAATTRAFVEREVPLSRVRDWHEEGTSFDRRWWTRAAELGWTALLVPEELGGGSISGDGVAELVHVTRQLGRTVAPGPLHPVSVVLAGLVEAASSGDPTDRTALIESLVDGTAVASWAVYEPGRGWDPLNVDASATPVANGFRIDGVKDRVEAGGEADVVVVVARAPDGLGQFLVPTGADGVTIEQEQSIDLVKRFARIRFDGVEIPASSRIQGDVSAVIERQSQLAQLLLCAEVLGILDAVMDFTVEWARNRTTFGRPLASYQALKPRFADMKMWQEACRAVTAAAAADIASRSAAAALSASIAKSCVGEHAGPILQQCVQLHGGIGVTWEHDLHVYLRRVAVNRAMYGTPEEHNLRVYAAEETRRNEREAAK